MGGLFFKKKFVWFRIFPYSFSWEKKKNFPVCFLTNFVFSRFFSHTTNSRFFSPNLVGLSKNFFFHQFGCFIILYYHFFLILSNWKKARKVWLFRVTQNLCVALPDPKKHEKSFQKKKKDKQFFCNLWWVLYGSLVVCILHWWVVSKWAIMFVWLTFFAAAKKSTVVGGTLT